MKSKIIGTKIIGFLEKSPMRDNGAQVGDFILFYNGVKLKNSCQLMKLKQEITKEKVEVKLLRNGKEIKIKIPAGAMGIWIKDISPEHKFDNDAVMIKDIGKLDWNLNMENSFLACVYLLEQRFGSKLSYRDVLGLSGYGFRFSLHKSGYCPSSPDATVSRDVGSEILTKLGYDFEFITLKGKHCCSSNAKPEKEMLKLIKQNIDKGAPVFAVDLIMVPEWGIITGYQKNGKELFCRTFFDETEGYDIAKKFPWVIVLIKGKKFTNIQPLYKQSLAVAKEMYTAKKYGDYFSGINGLTFWIKILRDEKKFKQMKEKQFEEAMHGNWWIYVSLMDSRNLNSEYLKSNKDRFGKDLIKINKLSQLCEKESKLLRSGMKNIPSKYLMKKGETWTQDQRNKQAKVIEELLKYEKQIFGILKK